MNDKARILRERARMCKTYLFCNGCNIVSIDPRKACTSICLENPEKAVEIIEAWAKEHPEKTYVQDLLEKLPNAKLNDNGIPYSCREYLYSKGNKCAYRDSDCVECWNEPMEG